MKNAIRILTVTFLGLAAMSAFTSPIRLSFTLDPAQTLPGVPVTFRVRAINTGTAPAALPIRVRLEARMDTDWKSICFANWENAGCATFLPLALQGTWPSSVDLAPGEERILDYLAGPGSPPWFDHPDLLLPGTYPLRLVSWTDDPRAESIASNEVVLTIQTPTGADAGAWQLISGSTYVGLERGRFADQLWSLYPDSVYTAMTPRGVPHRDDWIGYLNAFTEALAKHPPSGFADAYKLGIAQAHIHLMDAAMDEFNVQKAFQHEEAARTLIEELVSGETAVDLKVEATDLADRNVMTLAEIEEVVDRLRLGKPAPSCERAQVKAVRNAMAERLPGLTAKAKKTLGDVIADLDRFDVDAARTPPDMHAALGSLEQAAARLETALQNRWLAPADVTKALQSLAAAAELAATKAIDASGNAPVVKQSDLELARRKFSEGRAAAAAADFKRAISRFREALHKAQGASQGRGVFC